MVLVNMSHVKKAYYERIGQLCETGFKDKNPCYDAIMALARLTARGDEAEASYKILDQKKKLESQSPFGVVMNGLYDDVTKEMQYVQREWKPDVEFPALERFFTVANAFETRINGAPPVNPVMMQLTRDITTAYHERRERINDGIQHEIPQQTKFNESFYTAVIAMTLDPDHRRETLKTIREEDYSTHPLSLALVDAVSNFADHPDKAQIDRIVSLARDSFGGAAVAVRPEFAGVSQEAKNWVNKARASAVSAGVGVRK